LRVLNAGAFAAQWFWIDGHEMRIIEADGTNVQPYSVDVLQLSVAQRYSLLITARNDTSSNWAIHSNFDTDMFDTVPDSLQSSEHHCLVPPVDFMLTDRPSCRHDRVNHIRSLRESYEPHNR
jgi:FtsP/CotA-like multicopper oxidase with cupredoxin domain